MSSSTMRTAVFHATAIFTFSAILSHHLRENMFAQVLEDEGFRNMTNAMNRSVSLASTQNTPGRLTLDAGDTTDRTLSLKNTTGLNNRTAMNGTLSATEKSLESFYGRRLPREMVVFLVISALQYWWFIWLERMLPARPRHRDVPYQGEEKVEESEDREEEIVKKWISQGRVHRASLSWCNTFLKWLLDLTVGMLWYYTLKHMVREFLKLQSPKAVLHGLKRYLTINFISSYLSVTPLANLIAFIIIPAHKQIVFIAGAELVSMIFVTTLVRAFAIWAVKTDFVQKIMRNVANSAREMERNPAKQAAFQRLKNEL